MEERKRAEKAQRSLRTCSPGGLPVWRSIHWTFNITHVYVFEERLVGSHAVSKSSVFIAL
jgi:hypothetical protein